jgi:hypothetical protein
VELPRVYYPGGDVPSDATVVRLKDAEQIENLDIVVPAVMPDDDQ